MNTNSQEKEDLVVYPFKEMHAIDFPAWYIITSLTSYVPVCFLVTSSSNLRRLRAKREEEAPKRKAAGQKVCPEQMGRRGY